MFRRHWFPVHALLLMFLGGCAASEHIPAYPLMSTPDELQTLRVQSSQIKDISCQAIITLAQPNGDTVRFDTAVAMQPPAHARIRAYKFGQAVFDLTVTPAGVWLVAPPGEHHDQIVSAGASAVDFIREWLALMTDPAGDPNLHAEDRGDVLELRTTRSDRASTVAQINRKTLTVRKLVMDDATGQPRFTLTLSRYATSSGLAWPMRIEGSGVSGTILIEILNVELNSGLPELAFRPPARAEKLR